MNTPIYPMTANAMPVMTDARFDRGEMVAARPVITHEETPAELDNAAIAAVAEEVLGLAKLSLTAAIAEPEGSLRGTAEGEVAMALHKMPFAQHGGKAEAMQKRAAAMLDADRKAMAPVFGSVVAREAGGLPEGGKVRDVLGAIEGGITRAIDVVDLKITPEQFGVTRPTIDVPIGPGLRLEDGNLVVPRDLLGGTQFEAGGGEFEAALSGIEETEESAIESGVFDLERFEMVWGGTAGADPHPESEFEAVTDKLRLHVLRVRCVDETNPEWWGDDEIALGGVSVDEDGDTKKIAERFVGSGFRDGRSKTVNWPYHMFSLRESYHFPKRFGVSFLLAEKDNGRLSAAIQKLWENVKGAVSSAIAKVAAAAGKAVAAFLAIPAAAPVIAAAISKAVDWVLGRIVDWLIRLFGDDIFPAQTAWITIPSLSARWYHLDGQWGATWSPVLTKRFRGFGGTYDLDYRWQLYG
ncbi:hypothetical protein LX81_02921 [Palleronia aestuarii]|uniref:Uncharacterized protein n=1 Tax=Palleronia aestuarii TaxID=568105 RepID=A0A2W7N2K0_9RHOB|nr:hypothetical protein [Palleronia aestuarii]PZX14338.1 hypothetical protein LX81_02921 [Palleronia aestuarii]